MSLAKVLCLEDYRGKRALRVRLSETLYGVDPHRLTIFGLLGEIGELCDADRVATVWVDEYGSGGVHPHVVLDHVSDRPRRAFSREPLAKSWELGVPGVLDQVSESDSPLPATLAISLGSDGTRAWFVVAESTSGRAALDSSSRARIMFLAGECAAVLLHGDLDALLATDDESPGEGFSGWSILKDLEGRESDEAAGRRIAQRFVVGRIARMLCDDCFVHSPERLAEQVRRARSELPRTADVQDEEARLWHRTLDVMEAGDIEALGDTLVSLGEVVERQQHVHGALELYDCAYEAAMALARPRVAARAAFYSGRVHRRQASREAARDKYELAHRVADAAGLQDLAAHVLVGLALMKRDLGNIPAARADLEEAVVVAEGSGDPDSIGIVHHAFLGLEQIAGNLAKGLGHGWIAVGTYQSSERRTECVASLAAALMEYGDMTAAEDAWLWVAHAAHDAHYRIYANDALGHLAALRGDEAAFELYSARCEALGWQSAAPSVRAEILQHRGLSYRALGQTDLARDWLERAVTFAEEHGFNRVLFEAEGALESLTSLTPETAGSRAEAPEELRDGLRSMREELVGGAT